MLISRASVRRNRENHCKLREKDTIPRASATPMRPNPRANAPLSAQGTAGESTAKKPPRAAKARREIPAKSRSTITVAVIRAMLTPVSRANQYTRTGSPPKYAEGVT